MCTQTQTIFNVLTVFTPGAFLTCRFNKDIETTLCILFYILLLFFSLLSYKYGAFLLCSLSILLSAT